VQGRVGDGRTPVLERRKQRHVDVGFEIKPAACEVSAGGFKRDPWNRHQPVAPALPMDLYDPPCGSLDQVAALRAQQLGCAQTRGLYEGADPVQPRHP
jgi:hypothetical protein